MTRHHAKSLLSLAAAAAVFVPATGAFASGFATARFGGPHGNPTEANPSAIYYNPAGLGFVDGTRLTLDIAWALRNASYERDASAISFQAWENGLSYDPASERDRITLGANTGKGEVSNSLVSPMLGVASDFGTDLPFGVGFGFFVPFGGQSVWDTQDAVPQAPGAVDGSQRFYVTEGTIRTLALALGGAYVIEPLRLSIGISGNLYLSTIDTIRARNADGTDTIFDSDGNITEGRSWLEASSTDIGVGLGVLWEAMPEQLWIGASYQSAPNFSGEMLYEGELKNVNLPPEKEDVWMTGALPDIVRLGVRYRPTPHSEIRLFGDYTRWSRFEQQCIVSKANFKESEIDAACELAEDGAQKDPALTDPVAALIRRWDDAFGVRVGGSLWFLDGKLETFLGAGYDGNAVPDGQLEPALMDMDKFSIDAGGTYTFTEWFALQLALTNVFYMERDTTGTLTAERFNPGGGGKQPSSAGVYNQNIFLLNAGLEFTF